jgi:hypothetical protein
MLCTIGSACAAAFSQAIVLSKGPSCANSRRSANGHGCGIEKNKISRYFTKTAHLKNRIREGRRRETKAGSLQGQGLDSL